jgi:uncharacterized membrane protein (UPF0127 family)
MPRLLFAFVISFSITGCVACGDSYDNDSATTVTPAPAETVTGGQTTLPTITVEFEDGARITVEVADDATERGSGLSGRSGLAEDSGMLFVWEDEASHTLWMKDMLFDLDFVWIDADLAAVSIDANVPAQLGAPDSQLTQYHPASPAKYAIELDAGQAAALGIEPGDVLEFDERSD